MKDGTTEKIHCFDFKVGEDNGKAVMMFQISERQVYMLPLDKIANHEFDVKFFWVFLPGQGPNQNPFV